MTDDDRAQCAALAALLHATALVGLWGFALSGIAAGTLALTARGLSMLPAMGLGAIAILGVLERYFAIRLRLDARLFDALASGRIDALQRLDHALARIGLRPAPAAERSLEDRVLGTRRLMSRHLLVVACQSGMFLLALLT